MAESPRRVDLRLTIPVTAPYPEIALDLAAKFAEYAGASTTATVHVSKAVAALVVAADRRASVDLLLSAASGEVTVTALASD